ncbi:MAG: polysaccharide deacetylase family protein [Paludibaculum sp.]
MSQFVGLMYHNVCASAELETPDAAFARLSPSIRSYFVTTEQFESHLKAIGSTRWLHPKELGGERPGATTPRVLLTFDDGWAGSFDQTAPLLAKFGAQAIVFVTTGLIGHSLFASESTLRNAPAAQFEIGAHTVTHPFLSERDSSLIRQELVDSRSDLEDILGRPVRSMSVPERIARRSRSPDRTGSGLFAALHIRCSREYFDVRKRIRAACRP